MSCHNAIWLQTERTEGMREASREQATREATRGQRVRRGGRTRMRDRERGLDYSLIEPCEL